MDLLFEKKEEEMAFKMNDNLLVQSRKKIYTASYKLDEFIKANVSEEIRQELQKLISNRNDVNVNKEMYKILNLVMYNFVHY